MAELARVNAIVIPLLNPVFAGAERPVKVGSWTEDVDYRTFPLLHVKRMGGSRHDRRPTQFGRAVIELTAYDTIDLPTTETLYDDALEALYKAVAAQSQTPSGYLSSIKETMGATNFGSPFQDSWRVQGLIQLGIRPPRT